MYIMYVSYLQILFYISAPPPRKFLNTPLNDNDDDDDSDYDDDIIIPRVLYIMIILSLL